MRSSLLVLICSLFLFIGCTSKQDPRLSAINNLTTSDPHAALDSLTKIDESRLSGKDRHYYDFLTVKANDKAYVTHTSDSLILDVIDYYKSSTDKTLYSEVLYYGGRVYSDLGDLPTALSYFHRALDELPDTERSSKLESRIVSQTGRLLVKLQLYEEALKYISHSMEINREMNDTLGCIYALQMMAEINLMKKDYAKSEKLIKEALGLSKSTPMPVTAKSNVILSNIYSKTGRLDSAIVLINDNISHVKTGVTRNSSLAYAIDYYLEKGDYETVYNYAKEIIEDVNPSQKTYAYYMLLSPKLQHLSSVSDLLKMISEYRRLLEERYSENESSMMVESISKYNYQIKERERERAEESRRKALTILYIVSISLLITLIVILYLKNKSRRYIIRLHEALSYIEDLKNKNEDNLQMIETLKKGNEAGEQPIEEFNILRNAQSKRETSDDLRAKLREELMRLYEGNPNPSPDFRIMNSSVYSRLVKIVEDEKILKDNDSLWKDIEQTVNIVSPRFRENMNILYGGEITKVDTHSLWLIKFGFTPSQIAIIQGVGRSTISARRDKIGKKIFGKKIDTKILDAIIRLL